MRETAAENGLDAKIRFNHRVIRASWSTPDAAWTLEVERGPGEPPARFTCNFLLTCTGYYDYAAGYTPELPSIERFTGRIVHPQFWKDDIDYAGKRVVVIGSGATAMTLVPELAKKAAHVVMLQRSPTYVVSVPAEDPIANWLREHAPAGLAYSVSRWKNVLVGMAFFQLARRRPALAKKRMIDLVRKELGPDYDVEKHFTPSYNPGISASASCPTAISSPRSARGRRQSSPTTSSRSPRRGSGSAPARSSRPISWSRRPASSSSS